MDKSLFFIALIPSDELLEQLWDLKKEISQKYNTRRALNSPPHVTLFMPFQWRDDRTKELVNHLSKIESPSILLNLKNFAAFAPRVLYVDIELNDKLYDLYDLVRKSSQKILPAKDASYKNRGFTPHVTLAFRDLKKSNFNEAWEEYKDKEFSATQLIKKFSLLKHNGKNWDVFKEFPLGL